MENETKDGKDYRIIKAYVSIFNNVDLVGDVIVRGAFEESLKKKLPSGVWSHNWDEPIAKTIEAKEDEKGLYIEALFVEGVQKSDEAYKLIMAGVIDEFSIGFRILDDEWRDDGVRIIKKAKLYEWSPVLAGANPDTELVSIKTDEHRAECKCTDCEKTDASIVDDAIDSVKKDDEEVEEEEVDEEVEEEKEEENEKTDFVEIDEENGVVKVFNGKEFKTFNISYKYSKYLASKGTKVEPKEKSDNSTKKTIIRLAKKQIKESHKLIRLIK